MKNRYLLIAFFLSAVIHFSILSFLYCRNTKIPHHLIKKSRLIPFEIKKIKPKKIVKKKIVRKKRHIKKKIVRKKLPVSHIRKKIEIKEKPKEIKPVFGVTKKTAVNKDKKAIAVRVGNTLMKEQEKKFTSPKKVKNYFAGKKIEEFNPVSDFDLSKKPQFKMKIEPVYPEELQDEGIEGKVLLKISINKRGKIVKIKILKSDNPLFSKSAIAAIKKSTFIPGKDKNGKAVDATIRIPIKFEIDF